MPTIGIAHQRFRCGGRACPLLAHPCPCFAPQNSKFSPLLFNLLQSFRVLFVPIPQGGGTGALNPPQASKVIPSEILYRGLPCRCASRQAGARVLLVNLVFRWAAGLRDKAKLAAEPGDVEGAQVGAVQPHGAGERIVEAQQQLNDGALSAAAASHQRYGLARLPRGSF